VGTHNADAPDPKNETKAYCKLYYDELRQFGVIQPGDPQLINVCTYPSASPTSNQKDCVVTAGSGFLVINKWTNLRDTCTSYQAFGFNCPPYTIRENACILYNCNNNSNVQWNFTYTGGGVTKTSTVQKFGFSQLLPLAPTTWDVSEGPMPTGWTFIGFYCLDNQTNPTAVRISAGQTLVCYFVNFYGNRTTFEAIYGPPTPGAPFGNITLDKFSPNGTITSPPTPSLPPTASSCPVNVAPVFSACLPIDFATATSTCSPACVAQVVPVMNSLSSFASATKAACFVDYNTQNGLIFGFTEMTTITNRIETSQNVCPNGAQNPPPAAAAGAVSTCGRPLLLAGILSWLAL
jgi:hypothetical protein